MKGDKLVYLSYNIDVLRSGGGVGNWNYWILDIECITVSCNTFCFSLHCGSNAILKSIFYPLHEWRWWWMCNDSNQTYQPNHFLPPPSRCKTIRDSMHDRCISENDVDHLSTSIIIIIIIRCITSLLMGTKFSNIFLAKDQINRIWWGGTVGICNNYYYWPSYGEVQNSIHHPSSYLSSPCSLVNRWRWRWWCLAVI